MKHSYTKVLFCLLLFCSAGIVTTIKGQGAPVTVTFTHTGSMQTFTVPPCVGSMTITTYGAIGGTGQSNVVTPGMGGVARGTMTATPGQVFYLNVGGQGSLTAGGFNGGGVGGISLASSGGGGGGASDVRLGNNLIGSRIIVAAGGGGDGGNGFGGPYNAVGGNGGGGSAFTSASGFGGAGANGCLMGSNGGEQGGAATGYGNGGGGGGFASGGGGGGQPAAATGGHGCPGTLGLGGAGGGTTFICGGATGGQNGGGGGGGGYYGGGGGMSGTGGCNGGGGGGSSWTNSTIFTGITYTAGLSAGHGSIIITYAFNGSIVSAVASPSTICSGGSSTITASGASTYTWSDNSNGTSLVVSPGSNTSYTVAGTNTIGCSSSAVITVSVDTTVPTLTVTNTATLASGICPNSTVNITATGATSYSWSPAISNGVTFSPTTSATYVVTGYNACGSTTAATSVSVHPIPPVTASVSQPSVCSGNTVALFGGGALTYTWTGGAGGITDGQAFFPSATTIFTVTGTSALNCTASAVVGVTVVNTPFLAPVATPTLICMGSSGTVAATGASNYTWLPVPATNFAGSNSGTIIITPTVTATYTVVKANSNCYDTKVITIYVNALPSVFAIANPSIVCTGKTTTLSGGGANTYTWIPSSFNLVGTNVIVTPTANTVYTVTGSDGTCTATYNLPVSTLVTPTILAATTATSICSGETVTLTASGAGTGGTYTWTPGGIGSFIVVAPTSPISYVVEGTNTVNCSAQTSQVVIVFSNPNIVAVPNKPLVCVGGPSTITATGAHTYVWAHGPITFSTVVNPIVTTIYTVTGTFTNTGCSSTKTVMVQAYIPVTGISGPTAVCIGSSITINSAPAISYTWSEAGVPFSNFPSVTIGPTVTTTYSLGTTSMSSQVICVGANTVNILVNPLPIVTASTTRSVICRDYESTTLVGGGAVTYNWLTVGPGNSVLVSPTALQTIYTVEGTDVNGCVNTATILIKTSGCPGMGEHSMTGENPISVFPNPGQGEFNIKSQQAMELQLVNELGQVILEINLNISNNYQVTVKDVANGIYFVVGKNHGKHISQKVIVEK